MRRKTPMASTTYPLMATRSSRARMAPKADFKRLIEQHKVCKCHKTQDVHQQLREDATVDKAVYRSVTENAGLGQEGAVQNQQERNQQEVVRAEQGHRLFPVAVDQQEVGTGNEGQPGTKEEFSTGSHAQNHQSSTLRMPKRRPSKYPYRGCQCRRWTSAAPASSTNGPSDRPVLPMRTRTEWTSRQNPRRG